MNKVLNEYLDLCEQHARIMMKTHGMMNLKTLKSQYHALHSILHKTGRLHFKLRMSGYTTEQIKEAYNDRCESITGLRA